MILRASGKDPLAQAYRVEAAEPDAKTAAPAV